MKTILIDDEPLARKRLRRLLEPYADFIDIVGEAENGQEGAAIVDELLPDLIFLDVEMPVLNGFELLRAIEHRPKVVFTTAFEDYAVKAFEENSIDYLTKPIATDRLQKTMQRLREYSQNNLKNDENTAKNTTETRLNTDDILKIAAQIQPKKPIKNVPIKIGDKIILLNLGDIAHCIAEDKYVWIHTVDGHKHLTDYTLQTLEVKLPEQFLRIHRGILVNTENVKEYHKGLNGTFILVMKDKPATRLQTSRNASEGLRNFLDF